MRKVPAAVAAIGLLAAMAARAGGSDDPRTDRFIRDLAHADPEVRLAAARALGVYAPPRALVPLIGALKDADVRVRRAAAKAVSHINDPRAVEPLLAALKDPDRIVRGNAAEGLWGAGQRAVEALTPLVNDPDAWVRCQALRALVHLKAFEPVLHALDDRDSDVRQLAAGSLGYLGNRRAVGPLLRVLKADQVLVRAAAAESLGRLGDPRAVRPLVAALADESGYVHTAAGEALARMDRKHTAGVLKAELERGSQAVLRSVPALRIVGGPRCAAPLLAILRGTSGPRWAAARALVDLRLRQAVDGLIELLEAESEDVRRHAGQALRELTGEILADDRPELWRQWWARHRRRYLAESSLPYPPLTKSDAARAAELIAELNDPEARARAARELVALGPGVLPLLRVKILDNGSRLPPPWDQSARAAALESVLAAMGREGRDELGRLLVVYPGWRELKLSVWEAMLRADRRAAGEFVLRCLEVGRPDFDHVQRLKACWREDLTPAVEKLILSDRVRLRCRGWLCHLLVEVRGAKAVPFLRSFVKHLGRPPSVQQEALKAIAEVAPAVMAELLHEYLLSVSAYELELTAMALLRTRRKEVCPVLEKIRDDRRQQEMRRLRAARVLHFCARPGSAEALAPFLTSKDREVRRWAIDGSRLRLEQVLVSRLEAIALGDPDAGLRGSALGTLVGGPDHRKAIPILIRALDDAEPDVVARALVYLDRITGKGFARGARTDARKAQAAEKYRQWWRRARTRPAGGGP